MLANLSPRSRVLRVVLVAIVGWPCVHLVGCASAHDSGSNPATAPGRAGIAEAEQVAVRIERARLAGDWAEVNRHLSSVGYTAQQRSSSPSMPFAELESKAGRLTKFELLLSLAGPDYRDPATGAPFPESTGEDQGIVRLAGAGNRGH
jgi:hypothetical protein